MANKKNNFAYSVAVFCVITLISSLIVCFTLYKFNEYKNYLMHSVSSDSQLISLSIKQSKSFKEISENSKKILIDSIRNNDSYYGPINAKTFHLLAIIDKNKINVLFECQKDIPISKHANHSSKSIEGFVKNMKDKPYGVLSTQDSEGRNAYYAYKIFSLNGKKFLLSSKLLFKDMFLDIAPFLLLMLIIYVIAVAVSISFWKSKFLPFYNLYKKQRNDMLMILDSIDAIIVVSDIKTHNIKFANKKALIEFGVNDFTGKKCWDVFKRENHSICGHCSDLKKAKDKENKDIVVWEQPNYYNGASYKTTKSCIKWNDGCDACFQCAVDITEKKKVEDQLQEVIKQVKTANNFKTSFLARISHEIRTPIHCIIGLAKLVNENKNPVKNNEYISLISSTSNLLLNLVNDVLDMSKIEAGKEQVRLNEFDLYTVLHRVRTTLSEFNYNRNTIELDYNCSSNCLVKSDELKLVQIINNLIFNAIKFSPNGAKIILKVWQSANLDTFTFEVRDFGAGIPNDIQGKLFQEYEQSESETSSSIAGSGLGLSICRKYVDMLGGNLSVRSAEPNGSIFSFTIPMEIVSIGKIAVETDNIVESECAATNVAVSMPNSLANKKILIVDDAELNREIMIEYFKNTKVEFICAQNGAEAVEIYEKRHEEINLILMDIRMPVLNGYKACEAIRKFEATNNLEQMPIIAMTASAFTSEIDKCFECGMTDYVSKPIDFEMMFVKMFALIGG